MTHSESQEGGETTTDGTGSTGKPLGELVVILKDVEWVQYVCDMVMGIQWTVFGLDPLEYEVCTKVSNVARRPYTHDEHRRKRYAQKGHARTITF